MWIFSNQGEASEERKGKRDKLGKDNERETETEQKKGEASKRGAKSVEERIGEGKKINVQCR